MLPADRYTLALPPREAVDYSATSTEVLREVFENPEERLGLRHAAWCELRKRVECIGDTVALLKDLIRSNDRELVWSGLLQIETLIVPFITGSPHNGGRPAWWTRPDTEHIDPLIEALKTLPADSFPTALFTRSRLNDHSLCELAFMLDSSSPYSADIASCLATALKRLKTPQSIAARMQLFLKACDPCEKRYAAYSLLDAPVQAAVEYLESELQSETGTEFLRIACYLASCGNENGIAAVCEALESGSTEVIQIMSYVAPEWGVDAHCSCNEGLQKMQEYWKSSKDTRTE